MNKAFWFVIHNWETISLVGLTLFMTAEKLVKLSSWKWDDILIDGIRELIQIKKDRDVKKKQSAPLSGRTTRPPNKEGR